VLFTICGFLLIAGSINMVKATKQQAKKVAAVQKTLQLAKAGNTILNNINGVPINAHREIDENIVSQFKLNEIKYQNEANIYFFLPLL